MIRRSTWIVLASFVGLVVLANLLSQSTPEPATSTPLPTAAALWELSIEAIDELRVENLETGVLVVLKRDAEHGWLQLEPQVGPADAAKIEQAVSWLARPHPLRVLDNEESLLQFGLLEPRGRVTINPKEEEESEIFLIGNETPTGNSTYIAIEGKPEIYIVSKFSLDSVFNLTVDNLLLADDVGLESTETPLP